MSIGNIPVLSALQLGQGEKTVEMLQNQATLQQAAAQLAAQTELKRQQSQVEKGNAPDEAQQKNVTSEEQEKRRKQRQKQQKEQQSADEQEPQPPPTKKPFIGLLVNRKV